jgi:hypothetical protein
MGPATTTSAGNADQGEFTLNTSIDKVIYAAKAHTTTLAVSPRVGHLPVRIDDASWVGEVS